MQLHNFSIQFLTLFLSHLS